MPDEIELKLAIDPEAMQRLRRHPMLRALTQGEPVRRRLFAIYFDTADGLLESRGTSLRVRRENGRWTQTMKGKDTSGGSAMRRLEIECAIPKPEPDLSRFEPDQVTALLGEDERDGPWIETMRMQVNRVRQTVRLFDSEIVIAFDRGVIESGGHTTTVCEVELELASGRASRLYELAMMLSEAASFRIERLSKREKGVVLRRGEEIPRPSKLAPLAIDPASDPVQVFGDAIRACLRHLQANETVASRGEDPEGVHQARVAIRRMRALVALYKGAIRADMRETLRTELRWLQGALGPARDWDVLLTETLVPLDKAFPGEPALAMLREAAAAERTAAYVTVVETLSSARYVRLELQLALWLETGEWLDPDVAASFAEEGALDTFAGGVLDKAARKLRKAARGRETLDVPALHEVRILGKKLRYAGDFFESLYPKKPTRLFLKRLASLQDALGSLNDAAVAQRLLGILQARLATSADATLMAMGCGLVRGWQAALVAQDRAQFDERWKNWRQAERFWKAD